MKRDLIRTRPITSSFLSCEKDVETILRKLFVENYPYSDLLKRLLVINTKDCLDESNPRYKEIVKNITMEKLWKDGYVRLEPKMRLPEHEEIKSYIVITFDNFTPNNNNPEFRDCVVHFDIISHMDYWNIGNYRVRPLRIAGYIDGLLNRCRLSGIGTFQFLGCNEIMLDENLAGYSLSFAAIHGSDDQIPREEEEE